MQLQSFIKKILFSIVAIILAHTVSAASPPANANGSANNGCPVFDRNDILYIFSTAGDYSFDASLTKTSRLPSTDPSRPSFLTNNLVCIPSKNLNAVFFLNADLSAPNIMHSYRFATKEWRSITLTGTGPDLSSVVAVIDYDTLVIYAYSATSGMMRLGDAMVTPNSNLIYDTDVGKSFSLPWIPAANNAIKFDQKAYPKATMAHAFFNIYLFGAPGAGVGSVYGFRIHYGEWGSVQSVGGDFANMHGQTATFTFQYAKTEFEHDGAPSHVAFIPDDYSAVYVVDSYFNYTVKAPAPPSGSTDKTEWTRYAASSNQLVQYTPETGVVRKLDFTWLQSAEGVTNPTNPVGNVWVTLDDKISTSTQSTQSPMAGSGNVPGTSGTKNSGSGLRVPSDVLLAMALSMQILNPVI